MSTPGNDLVRRPSAQVQASGAQSPAARPQSTQEQVNAVVEEAMLETADRTIRQAFDTLRRHMNNSDAKISMAAADKLIGHLHHPTKQVEHTMTDNSVISAEVREAADGMSPEEKRMVEAAISLVLGARELNTLEGEVVEVVEEGPEGTAT